MRNVKKNRSYKKRQLQTDHSKEAVELNTLRITIRRIVERSITKNYRNMIRASDLEQMAWKSILRNRQGLADHTHSHFLAWVTKMINNRLIDQFRRKRLEAVPPEYLESISDSNDTPSELHKAEELRNTLTQDLPSEYEQLIKLREAGYDLNSIAIRLNIPKRTMQRMLHRLTVRAKVWTEK